MKQSTQAVCGSALAAGALATGLLALPTSAATITSTAHHHRLRLVVVPAHPVVGQHVRLYVTGSARGGRFYRIEGGQLGNFGFGGGPSCAPSPPVRNEYREPLTLHYGNTWKKPGTYHVSLTIGAACVHPVLAMHTVRGTVTVSGQQ